MTLPTLGWLTSTLGSTARLAYDHPLSISIDSRNLKPGDVFWALRGERDGHEYVRGAFESGAAAAVVHRGYTSGDVVLDSKLIFVDESLEALTDAAKAWRGELRGKIIGLTGSVGKTTTKDLVFEALGGAEHANATVGNFNNEIGVPLTVLRTPVESEYLVCEMGAARIGDIAHLCKVVRPHEGLVTAVAAAHVETFGSLEDIARGKGELYDFVAQDGTAYVPVEDARCVGASKLCRNRIGYGFCPKPQDWESEYVQGEQLEFDAQACARFRIGDSTVTLSVPGRPAAQAALAAMTVALHNGHSARGAAQHLVRAVPTRGRVTIRRAGSVTIIDDSYNANPMSMRSALETLSLRQAPRKVAILGDMLELGEYADIAHREVVNDLETAGVVVAVLIGPYFSHVAAASISRTQMSIFPSVEQALPVVSRLIRPNDLVLVKASRGMALDKVVQKLEETFS